MSNAHSSVLTRPLTSDDAAAFREARLEAITKTNLFISLFPCEDGQTPVAVETSLPLSAFEDLLVPTETSCFFGAFVKGTLAGFGRVSASPWRS